MKFKKMNDINFVLENVEDTPRMAIYLYLSTAKPSPFNGAGVILGNLLLQGTGTKTAEEIAVELENLGIEVSIDSNEDYLKVAIICLNENVDDALNLVEHFMTKSNFKTFDKEVFKFKGEVQALLDAPARKASDTFYAKLFEGHKYGIVNTKILETIDDMKMEHVVQYYKNLMSGRKIISVAGDIKNEDELLGKISEKFLFMKDESDEKITLKNLPHTKSGLYKIVKNDAKQAQIFQGWLVEGLTSKDCAALNVLNRILGASGLSSRLFLELRDKQGLAYTVRSAYKPLKEGASFVLYIGTDPSNIEKSLKGFKIEIEKMISNPPDIEELKGGIENHIGKFKYFYTQTNAQIAGTNGWMWISGLDFDYNDKLNEEIKNVTSEDVVGVVKKYLLKEPVTVVLAPEKHLNFNIFA